MARTVGSLGLSFWATLLLMPIAPAEADEPPGENETFQLRSGIGAMDFAPGPLGRPVSRSGCVGIGESVSGVSGATHSVDSNCMNVTGTRVWRQADGSIRNKETGLCLAAEGGTPGQGPGNGRRVVWYQCLGFDNFKWDWEPVTGGQGFRLRNRMHPGCLHMARDHQVMLWDCTTTEAGSNFTVLERRSHFPHNDYYRVPHGDPSARSLYRSCAELAILSQRRQSVGAIGYPCSDAPCDSTSAWGGWSPTPLLDFLRGDDATRYSERRQCRNLQALACCNSSPFLEAVQEGCGWIRQVHFSGGGTGRSFVFSCRTAREIYGHNQAEWGLTIGSANPRIPALTTSDLHPSTLVGSGEPHGEHGHSPHTVGRLLRPSTSGRTGENFEAIDDWEDFHREIQESYHRPLPPPGGR